MLDKTFIHRKIEFIQQDLLRLEEFKDKTFDEVAKDWRSFAIVKNLLMEIIGRGIDINQHILAEKFKPTISAPLDYAETFLKLGGIDVLPEDFTKEIAKSAGFRNAIVHGYNRIDKTIVFQTVGMAIEQYTRYCGYILQFLEKETENPQSHSAGFTLIELLVVFAVLIVTTAGGKMMWEKKAIFGQTVSAEESPVGILRGIACTPSNWLCKTEDTVLPDVLCCWWHCLPKEILPPRLCPTNADWGQKDGTGQTGDDRHYYYYDYDLEKVVEVPPVLPD